MRGRKPHSKKGTRKERGFEMKKINYMPTVEYRGKIYKLKSRKTAIPNLDLMDDISTALWLLRNTVAKGYSKVQNPLAGMADVLNINGK